MQIIQTIQNLSSKKKIILVVIFAALLYLPVFPNEFVYDDLDFFVYWDGAKSLGNIPSFFEGNLPTYHQHVYRPVRSVLQAIVYSVSGGGAPLAFHFFSLIVQVSSAIVVYFVAKEFFRGDAALITAMVFAALPVHTDNLAFMTASFDTAGAVMMFAAFYLYIRFEKIKRKKFWFWSIFLAFLGFLTYEITLPLPFLIILYDWLIGKKSWLEIRSRLKIYAPYFLAVIVFFVIRSQIVGTTFRGDLSGHTDFIFRMLTMLKGIVFYFYITIINHPLSVFHDLAVVTTVSDPRALFSGLGLLAIMAAGIFFYKKNHRILAFSIFWFFVALTPVSGIIEIHTFISEHYIYIATFAWALVIGYVWQLATYEKSQKYGPVLSAFILVVLGIYGLMTIQRNFVWKNSESLYSAALEVEPKYATRYYNALAFDYRIKKEYPAATEHAKKAIAIDENFFISYALLGEIYMEQDKCDEAVAYFNQAIAIIEDYVSAFLNRGVCRYRLKDLQGAEEDYLRALEIYPGYTLAQKNLGTLYLVTKSYESAEKYLRLAMKRSADPEIFYGLGVALVNLGQVEEGKKYLKEALILKPDFIAAQETLKLLETSGQK